jgi:hypothetical protein
MPLSRAASIGPVRSGRPISEARKRVRTGGNAANAIVVRSAAASRNAPASVARINGRAIARSGSRKA